MLFFVISSLNCEVENLNLEGSERSGDLIWYRRRARNFNYDSVWNRLKLAYKRNEVYKGQREVGEVDAVLHFYHNFVSNRIGKFWNIVELNQL